jgi:hypothetical protein
MLKGWFMVFSIPRWLEQNRILDRRLVIGAVFVYGGFSDRARRVPARRGFSSWAEVIGNRSRRTNQSLRITVSRRAPAASVIMKPQLDGAAGEA